MGRYVTYLGLVASLTVFLSLPLKNSEATAMETSEGKINFTGGYPQAIYDPENPTAIVDPGPSPQTNGALRLDFVPQLNFGSQKISTDDMVAYSDAQLFHGDSVGPRGNFIQVSDYRGTGAGWSLQFKQETQFRNEQAKHQELKGAVISFDQSWANSMRESSEAPTISKDVIRIDNIGTTYNLAKAEKGKGEGTWAISFGASIENPKSLANTLQPRLDEHNQSLLSTEYNQPRYENKAISLAIPGATELDPVPYQTTLTWILSEVP